MSKLSEKERERLKALAARPDSEIDFSDIPETEFSATATVGKYYRPVKEKVTMRLDADLLAWLKSKGEGYQTRTNSYLRRIMIAEQRPEIKRFAAKKKTVKPKSGQSVRSVSS